MPERRRRDSLARAGAIHLIPDLLDESALLEAIEDVGNRALTEADASRQFADGEGAGRPWLSNSVRECRSTARITRRSAIITWSARFDLPFMRVGSANYLVS